MYVPEYSITPNTLKNIASIEYNRSIIENTNILPNFENRLTREAATDFIVNSYRFLGESIDAQKVKKQVDRTTKKKDRKIQNLILAVQEARDLAQEQEIEVKDIKKLHKKLADGLIPSRNTAKYRNRQILHKTDPQEILAEISDLVDWINSLDAMDTNPALVSGIVKGQLEVTFPFEYLNFIISSLVSKTILLNKDYSFTNYTCLESYYNNSKKDYEQKLLSIIKEEDFTTWLEYYTEGLSTQTATAVEKVKLYAKDTKLAKVSGRVYLSKRQEKIVEYLQDYGLLQNKQFSTLFPNISEDTVLRDLKKLINSGIVVKRGSTKSSRYELA